MFLFLYLQLYLDMYWIIISICICISPDASSMACQTIGVDLNWWLPEVTSGNTTPPPKLQLLLHNDARQQWQQSATNIKWETDTGPLHSYDKDGVAQQKHNSFHLTTNFRNQQMAGFGFILLTFSNTIELRFVKTFET